MKDQLVVALVWTDRVNLCSTLQRSFRWILMAFVMLWHAYSPISANTLAGQDDPPVTPVPSSGNIFVGSLAGAYRLNVAVSDGMTRNWVRQHNDTIECQYPPNEDWGAILISVGELSEDSDERRTIDISDYDYLSLDLKGGIGDERLAVGIKERDDPDDGTEPKYNIRGLSRKWQTYRIPLYLFIDPQNTRERLKTVHIACELVFGEGIPSERVFFRNIRFEKCAGNREKLNLSLMAAIREGSEEIVKSLLDQGANVNAKEMDGNTPLMDAVTVGNSDLVAFLLSRGADIHAKNAEGCSALMLAVADESGGPSIDIVSLLLEKGAAIRDRDNFDFTPLMYACFTGNQDVVQILLDKGADVNAAGKGKITALMLTAFLGHVDVTRMLLTKGADIHAKTDSGMSILAFAALCSDDDTLRLLVEKGADITAAASGGISPLMLAVLFGNDVSVTYLIDKGVDVNAAAADGSTALMLASLRSNDEMVSALLTHGADVNARTKQGQTALSISLILRAMDVVHVKIVAEIVERIGSYTETLSHQKVAAGGLDVSEDIRPVLEDLTRGLNNVRKELHKGRKNDASDGDTDSLLLSNLELIKLLLEKGADANMQIAEDLTPLQLAKMTHDEDLLMLLKEVGAKK